MNTRTRFASVSGLLLLTALVYPGLASGSDLWPYGLKLTFSKDPAFCKEATAEVRKLSACRPFDVVCPEKEQLFASDGHELAVNTYGYTTIYEVKRPGADASVFTELEASLPPNAAILFLNRFEGDRSPRHLEMWLVDQAKLDAVLSIPVPEIDRSKTSFGQDIRSRNAAPFDSMLKQGTRLAQEWPPLLALGGKLYFVERECSGTWAYGAYYACNRPIKLTLKLVIPGGAPVPSCQWSRAPRKKS